MTFSVSCTSELIPYSCTYLCTRDCLRQSSTVAFSSGPTAVDIPSGSNYNHTNRPNRHINTIGLAVFFNMFGLTLHSLSVSSCENKYAQIGYLLML